MKKQIILLIAVLISCLLISCDFSSIRQLKPDSYYFTKTEPFEWDKDYVLAATNFPPRILMLLNYLIRFGIVYP